MHRYARLWLIPLSLAALTASCSTSETTNPASSTDPRYAIGNPLNAAANNAYTVAVIGDIPYGSQKLIDFPRLISLINEDPKVDAVIHLGDIKAGKNSECTDAYFSIIRGLFDTFADPLIYTPGDNEWTDCHVASKNNGLYTPTERLEAVRALFFPVPGFSLGERTKTVITQADDPANSAYVENVMWIDSKVLFATLNITGSNNDSVPWGSPLPANASSYPTQLQERTSRAQANHDWLLQAFQTAETNNVAGVVLAFQADMWDPAEPALYSYDLLVNQIGALATQFGKPVLLLEGDSHRFNVDNPYSATSTLHSLHPSSPLVPNVTRLVVEGSDGRTEYVRLTIDPKKKNTPLFSWERVPLN